MGSKVSQLDSLTDQEYSTKLEEGLIPIVIEDSLGNKLNKKFTLLDYWTKVLLSKVADECEQHKSIYNFGGEVVNPGGSSSGSIDSQDWQDLLDRVTSLESFRSSINSSFYPYADGSALNEAFILFRNSQQGTNNNILTSLSDLGLSINDIQSKMNSNKLYIKVVDPNGTQVNGYCYSPNDGLTSGVSLFPATGVILLRTDLLAEAMYHLEIEITIRAVYDNTNGGRYVFTFGTIVLSKPENVITNYTGGALTDHYIMVTPSWDVTTHERHELFSNVSGSDYEGTYENTSFTFTSATDNLIGNNYFNILVKIGNWSLTFLLTRDIGITTGVNKDITRAA